MKTTTGTITATGTGAGVPVIAILGTNGPDVGAIVGVSGTGTSAVLVIETLLIGGTIWYPAKFVDRKTGAQNNGSVTISPDNSTVSYLVDVRGCQQVRVSCSSGTALTELVEIASGQKSDFDGPIQFNQITYSSTTWSGDMTFGALNFILDSTTGTKFGTATTQKLAFFNATPIVQPANTVDYLAGLVNLGLRASGGTAAAAFPGLISSSSPTGGIGYATGAGGAVTQASSRTTGVTLNTVCGAVTLVSAAGSATPFTFTLTNSTIAATDVVYVAQKSGTDAYGTDVTNVAAGSCKITIADLTGTTTEQPVFNFIVFKGAAS